MRAPGNRHLAPRPRLSARFLRSRAVASSARIATLAGLLVALVPPARSAESDAAPPDAAASKLASSTSEGTPAPFGFRSLEIFKVDGSARGLEIADLDGDGRLDLVTANNNDGTLRLFYQRSAEDAKRAASEPPSDAERNIAGSDARFLVERVYVDRQIELLGVGRLDGDERPDLIYYSDPPELSILYQAPAGGVGESFRGEARKRSFPLRDVLPTPLGIRLADLDGDGKTDVVLLGRRKTYLLYQGDDGLAAPRAIDSAFELAAIETVDLDRDGRLDLLGVAPGLESSVVLRLAGPSGFGPERACEVQPVQAWLAAPLPALGDDLRLLTVQASNRRLQGWAWREQPAPAGLEGPLVLALGAGAEKESSRRLLTDVDGDGDLDLLVSYPDTATIDAYLQTHGELAERRSFPTLAEVNGLAAVDLDGDARVEIIVTSAKERAIGVMRWTDGRLSLPRAQRLDGEPLALAAGSLSTRTAPREPAAFVVWKDATDASSPNEIVALLPSFDARPTLLARAEAPTRGSNPSDIRLLDADGDGAIDVLLFVAYQDPFLFLQERDSQKSLADGALSLREISRSEEFGAGLLAKAKPASVTIIETPDVDGKPSRAQLLHAAGPFARLLELDSNQRLQVVEQWSARNQGSQIVVGAALDLDADDRSEILLLDDTTSSLDVLRRRDEDSLWERTDTIRVSKDGLRGVRVVDLDGDGRRDLILDSDRRIDILRPREKRSTLVEMLTFAFGSERDGRPEDLGAGDLNGDGANDLLLWTSPRYELAFFDGHAKKSTEAPDNDENAKLRGGERLNERMRFPLFEAKSYMRRSVTAGPDVLRAADVDGDGLEDLVLLLHNRVLIYFQDDLR